MTRVTAASLIVLAVLNGCSRKPTDDPPRVRYGQDECAFCGMIISDERFAAALRLKENGEIRDLLFDDIGDMIDYEQDNPKATVARRFVHDFNTHQWIDAEAASFVKSDQLQTPMGSGILATADAQSSGNREEPNHLRFSALRAISATKPSQH